MALTLEVHQKDGPRVVELAEGTLKVGKGGGSDIVVDDRAASRMHCVIEAPRKGPAVVIDLGSAAGTRVNGEPVTRHVLEPGDERRIGDFLIEVIAVDGRRPARSVCRFCERPYPASAFTCPAGGAPAPP